MGALSLTGGCVRVADHTPQATTHEVAIAFKAESRLLNEDAETKAAMEGFTKNLESFAVFGERIPAIGVRTTVFNGDEVTHHYSEEDAGVTDNHWDYTPLRFWNLISMEDRYDFVAVYPCGEGTTNENAVGNISVSTHYDYDDPDFDSAHPELQTQAYGGGDKYDIMGASYRREAAADWENRFRGVELRFSHIGSAVGVTVVNNSSSTNITVTSIYYKNLVVSGDAKVSLDNFGRTVLRWANSVPSGAKVRKLAKENPTVITPGNAYTGEYQIMIPQNLSLYSAYLYITYRKGEAPDEFTAEVPLDQIEQEDGTAITAWEIGKKYTYILSMRLDGGLLVTVTTTPWDVPVEGETPGILI